MKISGVAIRSFAPFAQQLIQFPPAPVQKNLADVHLFVGQNGTGKTRLLTLLMAAAGNASELHDRAGPNVDAMVVAKTKAKDWLAYLSGVRQTYRSSDPPNDAFIGTYFDKGKIATNQGNTGENFRARDKNLIAMAFRAVAQIRDKPVTPMAALKWGESSNFTAFTRPLDDGDTLIQALANLKIRAGMVLASSPNLGSAGDTVADRVVTMTQRLEQTIQDITGREFLFFVEQTADKMHLKVRWGSVKMLFQSLPDGLRSIISWLVSCVAKLDFLLPNEERPLDAALTLFLDEPETHLHPAWQRRVLPALQLLLPAAQIFVATHSPFVVSSVNHGWIYVFKANDKGMVEVSEAKPCSEGDTYVEVTEDILGVDEWYDPETEELLNQFRASRDKAVQTKSEADREAMLSLAKKIAGRSSSLELMMGRELTQFERKMGVTV